MYVMLKVFSSACVIGIITELARRFPYSGGILTALPLVSLLSLFWLSIQGQPNGQLLQFTKGVLFGLPGTAVLLIGMYMALKQQISMTASISIGIICWAVFLGLQNWVLHALKM